jgi:NAD-dependent dihydropyrimidine dehydrogenase PreA subunit
MSMTVVISESRGATPEQRALESELAQALARRPGLEVIVVPHLYDLAPDGPAVRRLQAVSGDLLVLGWLYPRAAFWVLDAFGVKGRVGDNANPAVGRTLWCLDLRAYREAETVLHEIERVCDGRLPVPEASEVSRTAPRVVEPTLARWYPVIDRDRCQNCLECLNFCLFGVYGLDEAGKIFVEQPDACRDGCPACARICPAGAVLFPADSSPAIAGDDAATASAGRLDLATLAEAERRHALGRDLAPQSRTDVGLDRLVDDLSRAYI